MTTEKNNEQKEFKIIKKISPFCVDPYNNRGGKGGKKGAAIGGSSGSFKGGKTINAPKFKGGSGGDR